MFLSEWRKFASAPCLAGKKDLMTARVSMLLKSRASPDILPFSLCNKKRIAIRHVNRLLFPTTLSNPSYDFGKYFGLRTYQHLLLYYVLYSIWGEIYSQVRNCSLKINSNLTLVLILQSWRGREHLSKRLWCPPTIQHDFKSQKTTIWTFPVAKP